jgi:molecular chaperone GrpE
MKKDAKNAVPPAATPEETAPAEDVVDVSSELTQITSERDLLKTEKAELEDRLLRRAAEFDNFRKRTDRQRQELLETAGVETIEVLLPILDDFERALKSETADRDYARGMQLIYQRLFDALKKQGLEPFESAGTPFDPNLHHAVEMVQTADVEDHVVIQDLQRGYFFKGRLLRPAMVRVAVTPA